MPAELIRSRRNPRVGRLRSLQEARGRAEQGAFLVEGLRGLEAALAAGAPLDEAWISPRLERTERGVALTQTLAAHPGIEVVRASDEVLEALAATRSHQGAVARCRLPRPPERPVPGERDVVVLADLQDPGNVGTIWRSAAAAGVGQLICGDAGADPYAPKTVRAAAGAVFLLPAWRTRVDEALLQGLREAGFQLVAADAAGSQRYHRAPWRPPVALLVGQEGPGLPPALLAACDLTVSVPMAPGVESLNAAATATLLMYEVARARDFGTLGPAPGAGATRPG